MVVVVKVVVLKDAMDRAQIVVLTSAHHLVVATVGTIAMKIVIVVVGQIVVLTAVHRVIINVPQDVSINVRTLVRIRQKFDLA